MAITPTRQYVFSESIVSPLKVYHLYTSKLNPKRDSLWQKPQRKVLKSDAMWYGNQVIGKDTLEQSIKELSKNAELSQKNTNHCMKATIVTNLDKAGW